MEQKQVRVKLWSEVMKMESLAEEYADFKIGFDAMFTPNGKYGELVARMLRDGHLDEGYNYIEVIDRLAHAAEQVHDQ